MSGRRTSQQARPGVAERLFARLDTSGECWLWQGLSLSPSGHGRMRVNGRRNGVHRIAWELVAGPIPDGLFVCHTCDNPLCCRNDDEGWYELNGIRLPRRGHLFLGTHAENEADKDAKGRRPVGDLNGSRTHLEARPRGEQNTKAKLTAEQVADIRARFGGPGVSFSALGREFGVWPSTIQRVVEGDSWRHIA